MSNYTDSEKEMHREIDEEYAIKYLDYNKLVKEYCDYQALKRETEFYKEDRIRFRANIFFSFISAYMASCLCLNMLDKTISLFALYCQSLAFAGIACFIISAIKTFIVNEHAQFKKKDVPLFIYIILLVLIPLVISLIF